MQKMKSKEVKWCSKLYRFGSIWFPERTSTLPISKIQGQWNFFHYTLCIVFYIRFTDSCNNSPQGFHGSFPQWLGVTVCLALFNETKAYRIRAETLKVLVHRVTSILCALRFCWHHVNKPSKSNLLTDGKLESEMSLSYHFTSRILVDPQVAWDAWVQLRLAEYGLIEPCPIDPHNQS